MSKFLKALQRAEEERLLQEQSWQGDGNQKHASPPPEESHPASAETKRSVLFSFPSLQEPEARDHKPPESRPASPEAKKSIPYSFPSLHEPEARDHIDAHCVSLLQPATFEAEQYRTLRYMVERAHQNGNLRVVALSSPSSGDGKTITALNLAGALAQARDVRILLIDGDLRQPSVARLLGLPATEGPGLVDAVLDPSLGLQDVVRPCLLPNLFVLPAGRFTDASYEVLKAPRMGEILAAARLYYDYIVLDTPPLIPFPDCRLLGKWADGFLVIVAAHKTSRRLVEEALHTLDAAQVLGLVFNRDDRPMSRYGSNRYGSSSPSLNGHPDGQRNGVRSVGGKFLRRGIFSKSTGHNPVGRE